MAVPFTWSCHAAIKPFEEPSLHALITVERMGMPKAPTQAEQIHGKTPVADVERRQKGQRGKDKVKRAKSRTLTELEFEALRPFLGISDERIEAARQAMVEEKKFTEIAEAFGWKSRQSVDRAVGIVWDEFQKYLESQAAVALTLTKKKPKAEQ
nr:TrfB-related DNA-binding protein [Pseudomonas cichorii]